MTDPITFSMPAWVFVGWMISMAISAGLQLRHTHYLKINVKQTQRELDAYSVECVACDRRFLTVKEYDNHQCSTRS